MAETDALGRSGRTRGVEDIGQIVRPGADGRSLAGRGHRHLDVDDRRRGAKHRAQLPGLSRGRDQGGHPGLTGDHAVAFERVVGVEQHEGPPDCEHAQHRGRQAGVVGQEDGDRSIPAGKDALQGRGDAPGLVGDLCIGQRYLVVLDRQAIGMTLGDDQEPIDDRSVQRLVGEGLEGPVHRSPVVERKSVGRVHSASSEATKRPRTLSNSFRRISSGTIPWPSKSGTGWSVTPGMPAMCSLWIRSSQHLSP